MSDPLRHELQERMKELRALHTMALLLQDDSLDAATLFRRVVDGLPAAWQFPEATRARIDWQGQTWQSPGPAGPGAGMEAHFSTPGGQTGRLSILCVLPGTYHGDPFLPEEHELLASLACMLGTWCQRREAEAALHDSRLRLEDTVRVRTRELKHANRRLRRLASELCLAEARERRELAGHLHDEIGQSLALLRMKLAQVRANQVFSGCDPELDSVQALLDRTLRSTRTLTQSLSPPVLYELGLEPACHWLAERFSEKHSLVVDCHTEALPPVSEAVQVTLFKSAQELLNNCWRHGQSTRITLELACRNGRLELEVRDDGCGFDPRTIHSHDGFGLFSIRTRLRDLGGRLEISSAPGKGCHARISVQAEGGEG